MKPTSILVAMDFSECSLRAFAYAREIIADNGEIILLNVIDTNFTKRIENFGFYEEGQSKEFLRAKSEESFKILIKNNDYSPLTIDTMIVEGVPFIEILKISKDLDVNMIALGRRSERNEIAHIFFGSVAEKVIRGSTIPVIVIP